VSDGGQQKLEEEEGDMGTDEIFQEKQDSIGEGASNTSIPNPQRRSQTYLRSTNSFI